MAGSAAGQNYRIWPVTTVRRRLAIVRRWRGQDGVPGQCVLSPSGYLAAYAERAELSRTRSKAAALAAPACDVMSRTRWRWSIQAGHPAQLTTPDPRAELVQDLGIRVFLFP